MKIETLEITEKRRSMSLAATETIVEVDYDSNGFIYEIRVHSEFFGAFVPVSEAWLRNNFPIELGKIYFKVFEANSSLNGPNDAA